MSAVARGQRPIPIFTAGKNRNTPFAKSDRREDFAKGCIALSIAEGYNIDENYSF